MTRAELACGNGGGSGNQQVKPINVFFVWYVELCRRAGMQPLNHVKPAKPKKENVLDFFADRLKAEEWAPVINALRLDTSLHVVAIRSRIKCKFLHDVDTEDKVKQMKRRVGVLYTTYISRSLVSSVCNLIKKNIVLSKLELDGLPINIEDVEVIVAALQQNKVIKWLSLKYCSIRDLGCQLLCNALKQMPNIEILNLSNCSLGPLSAQCIAKVVKVQQIHRYCESWHNSLRYKDPDVEVMAGLKRITLNGNPQIGDEGLIFILDELDDDLWIKALDMQRCGVTDNIAKRLTDVIENSRSLEIADFRNNELSQATIDHIFELLKQKRNYEHSECEFKWCMTSSSLRSTTQGNLSRTSIFYPPGKSKSVPKNNISDIPPLRKTNTSTMLLRKSSIQPMERCNRNISVPSDPNNNTSEVSPTSKINFVRSYTTMKIDLQRETMKRIQSEKENKRLKSELEKIKTMSTATSLNHTPYTKDRVIKFDPAPKKKVKRAKKPKSEKEMIQSNNSFVPGSNVKFVFEKKAQASSVMKDLVAKKEEPCVVYDDLRNYFKDILDEDKDDNDGGKNEGRIEVDIKMKDGKDRHERDSQISLINYINEIKDTRSKVSKKAK